MSSVDSIPSLNGVLILRCEYQSFMIIEIVMSILFNRCASLQADPFIFNIRKIQSQLSQRCSFHPAQFVFCFTRPSTLVFLQGLRFLNQVSFDSCEVSPFFSFMFLPGDSHEDSNGASNSSLILFFGGFKSSFVDHTLPHFNAFSCRCTS